jgi:hypothetical protein
VDSGRFVFRVWKRRFTCESLPTKPPRRRLAWRASSKSAEFDVGEERPAVCITALSALIEATASFLDHAPLFFLSDSRCRRMWVGHGLPIPRVRGSWSTWEATSWRMVRQAPQRVGWVDRCGAWRPRSRRRWLLFVQVVFTPRESGKAVVCRREVSGGAGGTVPNFPVHRPRGQAGRVRAG